jgi:hypothetical protein
MAPNYCLVATSAMFLVPSYYGYNQRKYGLCGASLVSSMASIQYWIHPIIGWRLSLDRVSASCAGMIYFLHGYQNINNTQIKKIGYLNGGFILVFYMGSEMLYSYSSSYWIYSHMIFHLCTTIGQLFVIHYSM